MEKSPLEVFTDEIVADIKTTFGVQCRIGKKAKETDKNKVVYYILCLDGTRKLLLHNITPLTINYKSGVMKHITQFIKLWKEGANLEPINVNDDVCSTLFNHIATAVGMKDKLPKATYNRIVRKLKVVVNQCPQNVSFILQGLDFYFKGKFATKQVKPKVVKHGIVVTARTGNPIDVILPIWPMAKDQGIVDHLFVPKEIKTDVSTHQDLIDIAEQLNINPMSLVYTFMLIMQFGTAEHIINEHKTHTVASKTDLADLATSLGAKTR